MPGITKPNHEKKMKQACDECHKRRVRCAYDSHRGQCNSCERLGVTCAFLRVPLKRGPNTGSRKERRNNGVMYRVNSPPSPRDSRRSSTSSNESERSNNSSNFSTNDKDYKIITLLTKLYQNQFNNEWIPLLPFTQEEIINMLTNSSNIELHKLFYHCLKLSMNEIIEDSHLTLSRLTTTISINSLIGNNDDIVLYICSLLLAQALKPNRILLAMSIGIWHELQQTLPPHVSHRLEMSLNILDLLQCPADTSLTNRSIKGFTQKYFSSIDKQTIQKLQFFESLRESQLQSQPLENFSIITTNNNMSLCERYMSLVSHKHQLIEQLQRNIDVIPSLTSILQEIKQLLQNVITPNKSLQTTQRWFAWAAIEEARRDVQALRDMPAHLLRGLMTVASNNNKQTGGSTIDLQILQVTQAMNDLVECTGLLGGLLGGNAITVGNTSNTAMIPISAPVPTTTSPRANVLEINHIINHDRSLPQLVVRQLSNRCA
ncbi:hypothetical protein, no similarity [Maudiozyma saulgeensis]|uniref:Zn(2)-C6 fungal-type domain-containing protein n=1 Tax=Maudiozyma saulgeensis TaxID=1789683 RepID=A0A1X7R7Z3_9SACH|nr:hypothetical protein, no similarity [Kazachstania saulgeensis]